jgi:hypothetical protein
VHGNQKHSDYICTWRAVPYFRFLNVAMEMASVLVQDLVLDVGSNVAWEIFMLLNMC